MDPFDYYWQDKDRPSKRPRKTEDDWREYVVMKAVMAPGRRRNPRWFEAMPLELAKDPTSEHNIQLEHREFYQPEVRLAYLEQRGAIETALARLEKKVGQEKIGLLRLAFGLGEGFDDPYDDRTMKSLSEEYGVCKERIRQIVKSMVGRLHTHPYRKILEEYR